jgi:hypothetical protein
LAQTTAGLQFRDDIISLASPDLSPDQELPVL